MENNGIQATPNLVRSILAPILQPGANLQNTQVQLPNIQQQTATSGQEQQNLQASNPGIQAQSQTQQVQATQNLAGLAAGKAIQKGMSLGGAIQTFGALGVSPDDVFQKYLASSPNGFPKESLNQLKNMGVSDKALGSVGDLSSFADRQNMRNAVEELRGLRDTFDKTSTLAKLPLGNTFGSGKVYEGQRQLVGQHLASLIQGAPQAASSAQGLMSAIPDSGNISQLQPGEANQQFSKAEQTLLQSKGYTYKDLGLTPPEQQGQQQSQQTTGSHLLNNILNKANENPPSSNNGNGGDIRQGAIDVLQGNLKQAAADTYGTNPEAIKKNVLGSQEDVGVGGANKAMAAEVGGGIAAKLGLKALEPILGKTVESAAGNVERLPGAVKSVMRTGAAMGQTGIVRGKMLEDATNKGVKIAGNDIIDNITNWARQKTLGSSDPKDIQAVKDAVSIAKKQFGGKTFDPNELKGIYDNVSKAFTKGGDLKAPIQAELDNAKKQAFDKVLGGKVPGWNQATNKFSQLYDLEKSTGKKIAGRAATTGIGYLMGLLGFEGAKHLVPEL